MYGETNIDTASECYAPAKKDWAIKSWLAIPLDVLDKVLENEGSYYRQTRDISRYYMYNLYLSQ